MKTIVFTIAFFASLLAGCVQQPSEAPAATPEPAAATPVPSTPTPAPAATSVSSAPTPAPAATPASPTSYLGLWKAEKVFALDNNTNDWKEGNLTIDFYFEYTGDGRWCVGWDAAQGKCLKYDTYTVEGDVIKQHQEGLVGPPWRYKWKLVQGKLELTSEIFLGIIWLPFIRYLLAPVARTMPASSPTPSPASVAPAATSSLSSITCDGSTYAIAVKPKHLIMSIQVRLQDLQRVVELKNEGLILELVEISRNEGSGDARYNQTYRSSSSSGSSSGGLSPSWAEMLADLTQENAEAVRTRVKSAGQYALGDIEINFGNSDSTLEFTCKRA